MRVTGTSILLALLLLFAFTTVAFAGLVPLGHRW
jgi:hypothetical protein